METFIDLHCHPSLKPYGQSFKQSLAGQNSQRRKQRHSIWYYDSPGLIERGVQAATGICKFTQSDCTTLAYGNTRIVCASLYPIERAFFDNKLGTGDLNDMAVNFITGVGKPRVDFVQSNKNYFSDLENELAFYKQMEGVQVTTEIGRCTYQLAHNYQQIQQQISKNEQGLTTVFFILSIEGLHVLHNNYDITKKPNATAIMANVAALRNWQPRPFFVTVAHHFYNQFCGHAQSLTGLAGTVSDQTQGMNDGFTPLGMQVVKALLNNTDGKRILIDIKHMSVKSRQEYFDLLANEFFADNIPVIVSHGAVNGLRSAAQPVQDFKDTAPKLLAVDINFYDNEILTIAKSGGIFGFQLDERRIASEATLKNTKRALFINKVRHYRAELLWNQVQHIAELLNHHDLFAWDIMAIGSDFDGIINPLNGYLTAEDLEPLQGYLERYVYNYMQGDGKTRLRPYNQISASEVVNRLFSINANNFLQKWFV